MTWLRVVATLAAFWIVASPSYGQEKLAESAPAKLKLSKAQMSQYQSLTELVDSVMAGKESAPSDVKLRFQNHFIKSATNVFVPYVLEISAGRLTSFPVAMYVRAVQKAPAPEGTTPSEYPFTDLYFHASSKTIPSTGQDTAEVVRALELPPGEFDVYIAMAETPARNSKTPPKRVVHTHALTVPDFSKGLTTSTIILGKSLEEASQPPTAAQQMEQPFTMGGQRITPTFTPTFSKSGEMLFLFLIYNEGANSNGKPDLDVNYSVFRGSETKPFGKLPTTSFNATTLPAEFNLNAGHQVLVAQGIPLATFAPGEYKLEIAVSDKTNGQTIQRPIQFTVAP
jgi:hypothetical protein